MRALLAACLIPSLAAADPCDLAPDLWSRAGQVVEARGFTVLVVTRFHRRQGDRNAPGPSGYWVDDVPSDTLGADAICDRVQLETPLPMDGAAGARMTMQQGERLSPAARADDYLTRLKSADRVVEVPPARYFVALIDDLDAPDWRDDLLRAAAALGEIDTKGWMIGLPGALYLVPLAP